MFKNMLELGKSQITKQ